MSETQTSSEFRTLTREELDNLAGEELPDRELMSILPQPDGGFVYIEPTVEPGTEPPPEDPKEYHLDW
jgi:hypothetical protein